MPSEPTELTSEVCQTPGCGKIVRARGFCVACYYRYLRRGTLKSGSQTKRWKHRLSNIDTEARTATCTNCGVVKITSRDNGNWRCSVDSNTRSRAYKRAYRQSKKEQLSDS